MKIVIITKDQPEFVPIFEEFLRGYDHVYVIDRPTKDYPSNIPAIVNYPPPKGGELLIVASTEPHVLTQ